MCEELAQAPNLFLDFQGPKPETRHAEQTRAVVE